MDKDQTRERIEKLRKFIDYHRKLYHTFDTPLISDEAFDTLKNELEELEYKYPDLVTKTSPTQIVGGKPLDKFVKVKHEFPMLSFDDAFPKRRWKNGWTDSVIILDITPLPGIKTKTSHFSTAS